MSNNHIDKHVYSHIPSDVKAGYGAVQRWSEQVSTGIGDAAQLATNATVLALSAAWIGIGMVKPARTAGHKGVLEKVTPTMPNGLGVQADSGARAVEEKRYDYKYLFSLRLGDYFMPLSQTFNLRAKKRLNVCSLVDGIDIIQQTRHEAKTIDCSLRLTLRENQPNLEIVSNSNRISGPVYKSPSEYITEAEKATSFIAIPGSPSTETSTDLVRSLLTLSQFLQELYETDAIFKIENKTINEVFGVEHAIISEYDFKPQTGGGTFQFDFTLTEVIISDDTLTFDKREIGG